ncbi:unnamed protein product [Soboliphyme baturini]|uniref:UEV domain-containing protein n=1 Tax=Soboliphyme baturini TaxID=241478 RepID=A0A183IVI4_9BILA|nr:unnamed protein product [Soboliphyme baturini]
MSNAKVLQLLNSVKAFHVDLATRDILAALSQFPDLVPKISPFASETSRELHHMFCLNGTIAVRYHDTVYHIPISVYLSQNYPFTAPSCFVSPTSDMVISPSVNVDASGRVYLPYITDWKHPQSDLASLLQVMSIIFGENCPVFTKTRGSSSRPPVPGSQPPPPYPVSGYPFPASDAAAPNRPPYPTGNVSFVSQEGSAGIQWPSGTGTIQPEHIRASLLSAVEDQLRKKLREIIGTASAELQSVKGMKEELLEGQQKLQDILMRMEMEQTQLDNSVTYFESHLKEIGQHIGNITKDEDVSIDETIDTTAPLYRQ